MRMVVLIALENDRQGDIFLPGRDYVCRFGYGEHLFSLRKAL